VLGRGRLSESCHELGRAAQRATSGRSGHILGTARTPRNKQLRGVRVRRRRAGPLAQWSLVELGSGSGSHGPPNAITIQTQWQLQQYNASGLSCSLTPLGNGSPMKSKLLVFANVLIINYKQPDAIISMHSCY
jgi:hypothetical protein